jgi:hypothetical protein
MSDSKRTPVGYRGSFDDEVAPGGEQIDHAYNELNAYIRASMCEEEDLDIKTKNLTKLKRQGTIHDEAGKNKGKE